MKSLPKEMFIMALLLMIVVFMIGIVFYNYMPNNKTVPAPVTYETASDVAAVLQEIASSSTYSGENAYTSSTESIIKSYSIGLKELSNAASRQSYESGKTNPFDDYVATNNNSNNNGENTNTTNNTTNTNSTSTQKTTNSNSTGTFFEKGNSK